MRGKQFEDVLHVTHDNYLSRIGEMNFHQLLDEDKRIGECIKSSNDLDLDAYFEASRLLRKEMLRIKANGSGSLADTEPERN